MGTPGVSVQKRHALRDAAAGRLGGGQGRYFEFLRALRGHPGPGEGTALSAGLLPPPEDLAEEPKRVRAMHGLPERYLFYPAQFWPHKNHKRIVEALALLRDRGTRVDVVFC